jgi:hypothetical protein
MGEHGCRTQLARNQQSDEILRWSILWLRGSGNDSSSTRSHCITQTVGQSTRFFGRAFASRGCPATRMSEEIDHRHGICDTSHNLAGGYHGIRSIRHSEVEERHDFFVICFEIESGLVRRSSSYKTEFVTPA